MATVVKKCNCESKFQDELYGKGIRLCNTSDDSKFATCTVCGKKI